MKCNEELLYIEDANKRKLFYRFTPAAIASNFVPLVVVLHGEENEEAMNFEYKMWNVLTPIDSFECNKELLQELIRQIAEDYECEDHIYLYGSSMRGYEAIAHGIYCKANAVFATVSRASDLSNLLNPNDSFPIFYLSGSPTDETENFVEACTRNSIKFHLDFCPDSQEDEIKTLKEVLDMFEHMTF